jgi:hypothetical protein
MGLLEHTSAYLAGPVELAGPQASDWRNRITDSLRQMDVIVLNPIQKPEWVGPSVLREQDDITSCFRKSLDIEVFGSNSAPEIYEAGAEALKAQRASRNVCLRLVKACDWCICNLPGMQTIGTIEELSILAYREAPVFFVCQKPSMWLISMFLVSGQDYHNTFFKDEASLMEYLTKIDKGAIPVNPLLWITRTWGTWKLHKTGIRGAEHELQPDKA